MRRLVVLVVVVGLASIATLWIAAQGKETSPGANEETPTSEVASPPISAQDKETTTEAGGERSTRANATPPASPDEFRTCEDLLTGADEEAPIKKRSVLDRDERLAAAHGAVPELGGYRYDRETKTLYLYLTDGSVRDSAVTALQENGLLNPERVDWRVVVLQVDYTVAQLLDWKSCIEKHDGFAGMNSIGVQPHLNQIRVGVVYDRHVGPITADIASLGIPEDAIAIEAQGPICFMVLIEDDPGWCEREADARWGEP